MEKSLEKNDSIVIRRIEKYEIEPVDEILKRTGNIDDII